MPIFMMQSPYMTLLGSCGGCYVVQQRVANAHGQVADLGML